MNIVIFIGGLSGGGAERVVCNLSNYLSKRHNVTILTMSDNKPAYDLSEEIKRVSLVSRGETNNYFIKNIKRIIRFRKYVKKSNADVYIVMLPITINLMLLNRNIIKGPIIVSERNDPITRYKSSKIQKWIMQMLYPRANGFVFQTDDAMRYYEEAIGSKGIVIPNAINQEFVKKPYEGLRDKNIVGAGRFVEQKNFTMLLEAFAMISKKHTEYNLIIYGEGPQKSELLDYAKKLGINNRVEFPGYVKDFGSRIIDASLFVLSSNYEGMPNALMEAMALGLPCISTDCPVGGPRYLIKNGENGFLIPIGDTDNLAEVIDKVLSNKEIADTIGNNARQIVDKLSSKNIYARWESYICEIAKINMIHKM